MTRFEAVAWGCLALMIVLAVIVRRSAKTRGRARKPEDFRSADDSIFQPGESDLGHQPQGQGHHHHHHHDGSAHGSVDGGHGGVDGGHAGGDAGGGGGAH